MEIHFLSNIEIFKASLNLVVLVCKFSGGGFTNSLLSVLYNVVLLLLSFVNLLTHLIYVVEKFRGSYSIIN